MRSLMKSISALILAFSSGDLASSSETKSTLSQSIASTRCCAWAARPFAEAPPKNSGLRIESSDVVSEGLFTLLLLAELNELSIHFSVPLGGDLDLWKHHDLGLNRIESIFLQRLQTRLGRRL